MSTDAKPPAAKEGTTSPRYDFFLGIGIISTVIGFIYNFFSVILRADNSDFFLTRFSSTASQYLWHIFDELPQNITDLTLLPLKLAFAVSWALGTTLLWPATVILGAAVFGLVGSVGHGQHGILESESGTCGAN